MMIVGNVYINVHAFGILGTYAYLVRPIIWVPHQSIHNREVSQLRDAPCGFCHPPSCRFHHPRRATNLLTYQYAHTISSGHSYVIG